MTFGLVYGYGQFLNGDINKQTIGRCEKAVELHQGNKTQRICITVSAVQNGIGMSHGMQHFFRDHGVPKEHIIVDPRGKNTAGETDVFLRLVKRHFGERSYKTIPISTWYHTPRIWWLWLTRKHLVRVGVSWKEAHWRDLTIEPLKLAYALLFPLRSSKVVS